MTKKEHLTKIIVKLLETNIELMTYFKSIASDKKSVSICSKSIRDSKKALKEIYLVHHEEILQSLYNTLISGKENTFALAGTLICSKNFQKWDKTKKGFQEFLALEEEAHKKHQEKVEEQEKMRKSIEEAKQQGKKVEMVYDEKTKSIKPFVVEDSKN